MVQLTGFWGLIMGATVTGASLSNPELTGESINFEIPIGDLDTDINRGLVSASETPVLGIEKAIRYLEKGADVNFLREDGTTPLIAATRSQNLRLMHLLLDKNAQIGAIAALRGISTSEGDFGKTNSVNVLVNQQHTALHEAVRVNNSAAIGLLLSSGLNPNALDVDGLTPLQLAAKLGHAEALVRLLWAVRVDERGSFMGNCGLNPNLLGRAMTPALAFAVRSNCPLCVAALVHVSDLSAVTQAGMSPLHEALRLKNEWAARVLLAYRPEGGMANAVDLLQKDALGETPLMAAVRWGNVRVVRQILAHPSFDGAAQLAARSHLQRSAIDLAVEGGKYAIIRAVVGWRDELTKLGEPADYAPLMSVGSSLYVDRGVDVEAKALLDSALGLVAQRVELPSLDEARLALMTAHTGSATYGDLEGLDELLAHRNRYLPDAPVQSASVSSFPHMYKAADRFEVSSDAAHDASVVGGIDSGLSTATQAMPISPKTEGMQPLIHDETEVAKWRSFLEARKERDANPSPALLENSYDAATDPFAYLDADSPFTLAEMRAYGLIPGGRKEGDISSNLDDDDIGAMVLDGDWSSEDSLGLVLPDDVDELKRDTQSDPALENAPADPALHQAPLDVEGDVKADLAGDELDPAALLASSFIQSSDAPVEGDREVFQALHDESVLRYEDSRAASQETAQTEIANEAFELPEHNEGSADISQHTPNAKPNRRTITDDTPVPQGPAALEESVGAYSYSLPSNSVVPAHVDSSAILAAAKTGRCANVDAVLGATCDRSLLLSRDAEGRTILMLNLLHAGGVCLNHLTHPLVSRARNNGKNYDDLGADGIAACPTDLLFELLLSVDNQRASVLQLAVDHDLPAAAQLLAGLPYNPRAPLPTLLTLTNARVETPLHSAVRRRNDVVLRALLSSHFVREGLLFCDAPVTGGCVVNGDGTFALPHGGVVNQRNANGETPLLLAVSVHSETMTRSLLRVATSLDASLPDVHGVTPLMRAVASSAPLKLVQLLLRHPSTCVAQEDAAGNTALSLALSRREMHYLSLLVSNRCLPLHKPLSQVRLSEASFRQARGDHLASEGLMAASTLRSLADSSVKLEHPLVAIAKVRTQDFTPLVMALRPSIQRRHPDLTEEALADHLYDLRAAMARSAEPILSSLILSKERPSRAGASGVNAQAPILSSLYESSTRAFPLFKTNTPNGRAPPAEWFTFASAPLSTPSVHLDIEAPSLEEVVLPPSDPLRTKGYHAWSALRETIEKQRTPEANLCSVVDADGRTPLWWAAARGRTSLLLRMLEVYSAYVDLQATRWEECDPHRADSVGISPWEAGLHGSHKAAVTALLRLRSPSTGSSALASLLSRRSATGARQLAQLLSEQGSDYLDLSGVQHHTENSTASAPKFAATPRTPISAMTETAALKLESDPVLLLKTKKALNDTLSAIQQNPEEETDALGELEVPEAPTSPEQAVPSGRFSLATAASGLVADASSLRSPSLEALLLDAIRRQASPAVRLVTPDAQWTVYEKDATLETDALTHALFGASHAFALAFSGQVPGGRSFVDSYYDSDGYLSAAPQAPLFAVGAPEWVVMEAVLWGGAPRLPPASSQVRTLGVFLQLETALTAAIGGKSKDASENPLRTLTDAETARVLNLLAERWTAMHVGLSSRVEEVSPVAALSLQKQARDMELRVEVGAALASYDPSGEVSEAQAASVGEDGVETATPTEASVGAQVRLAGQSFFESLADEQASGRLAVSLPFALSPTSALKQTSPGASLVTLEIEDVLNYNGTLASPSRLADALHPSTKHSSASSRVPWPAVSATSLQSSLITAAASLSPTDAPVLYTQAMQAAKNYQGEPVQRPAGAVPWVSLSRVLGVPIAALQFVTQQPPLEALRLAVREEALTLGYEESVLPASTLKQQEVLDASLSTTNDEDEDDDMNLLEPPVRPTVRELQLGSRDAQGRTAICLTVELEQAPAFQTVLSVAASVLDGAQALKRTPPSSPYGVSFDSQNEIHLHAYDDEGAWLAADHSQHLLMQAQALEELASGLACAYDRGRADLLQAILSRAPLAGEYLLTSVDLIVPAGSTSPSAGSSANSLANEKEGRVSRAESLAVAVALQLSRVNHQFIATYPTSAVSNAVASLQPLLARVLLRHRDAVEMLRPLDRTAVPSSADPLSEDISNLVEVETSGSIFFSDDLENFHSPLVERAVRDLGQLNLDQKVLRVERRKDKARRDLILHDLFSSPAVTVPSSFHHHTAIIVAVGILAVCLPFILVLHLASVRATLAPHTLARWVLRFDFLGLHPLKAAGNDLGRASSKVRGWFSDIVKASLSVLTGASAPLSGGARGHKRSTMGMSLQALVQVGCLLSAVVLASAVAGRQDVTLILGVLFGLGLLLALGSMRALVGQAYREVHLCFQELGLATTSSDDDSSPHMITNGEKSGQLKQRLFKSSTAKRGLVRRQAGRPTMNPLGVLQQQDEQQGAPQFDLLEEEACSMSRRSGGASEDEADPREAIPADDFDDVALVQEDDSDDDDEEFMKLLNQVGTKAAGAAVEVSSSVARRAIQREEDDRAEAEQRVQAEARAALRLGRSAQPASATEAAALNRLNRLSLSLQGEDGEVNLLQTTPWLKSKGYFLVSLFVVGLALLTGLASPLSRLVSWDYGVYVRSHYAYRFFSAAPFAFSAIEALGCAALFLLALVVLRPLGLAALLAAHRLQEVQSLNARLSPVSVAKVTRPADVTDEQRRMRAELGFCADDGHWMAHVRQQQAATKRFAPRWSAVRVVLEPAVVLLLLLGGGVLYVLAGTEEANAVRRLLARSLPGLTLVTLLFACSILVSLTLLLAAKASVVAAATLRKFEVGVRLCPLGASKREVLERVATLLREAEPRAKFFGVRASYLTAALVGGGGCFMLGSLLQALKPEALHF